MPYTASTQKKYGENPLQKRSGFKMRGWSPFTKASPTKKVETTRTKTSLTKTDSKTGKSSTYNVTDKKENKDGSVTVTLTNDKGNTIEEQHSST